MSHLFPLFEICLAACTCKRPDPSYVAGALSYAYSVPCVEKVKGMGAFEHIIIGGEDKASFKDLWIRPRTC